MHILIIRKQYVKTTHSFAITLQNSLSKNKHAKNQCPHNIVPHTYRESINNAHFTFYI